MPLGADTPGGARPLNAPAGAGSANNIVAGLMQTHPEQFRGIVIPMFAVLDGTTAPAGADTFRTPTTHDLVIEQLLAHIAPVGLADTAREGVPAITANITLASYLDRLIFKASNALVTLRNLDREQRIIEYRSLPLSTLLPAAGGQAIHFGMTPHKVPAGESLRLDVSLANPDLGGGATQYGLVLVGKLVRVARS